MRKHPHILLLFLDGVGIGKKDPYHNPFFNANLPAMQSFFGGRIPHLRDTHRENTVASVAPLNATLGLPDYPQSGTGQAALLTGINTARLIGKHFGPYLYSSLKPIVAEKNIFHRLQQNGRRCFFANSFPHQLFEYLATKNRSTAITHAWLASGGKLNDHRSLEEGRSLSADITNERWHKLGYPHIPIITPQNAGKRLVRLTEKYDFVIYEYFYTDHAGHSQSMKEAVDVLEILDTLIGGIIEWFDMKSMLLIITSDHGNIEDLSIKSHTRNPVPLIAYGKHHRRLTLNVKKITEVTPVIVKLME